MRPITLTTTIKNHATLPLLLKITDRLVSEGLLDSLRLVDCTPDEAGTENIRTMVPHDGESGTRIVAPDLEALKRIDSTAHVAMGMTGYSHKPTALRLRPGRAVYVMTKATIGSYIAISPEPKAPGGAEIGLERARSFIRLGRGGGTPVTTVEVSSVGGGRGWCGVEIRLDGENKLTVRLDTGETMSAQLRSGPVEFVVSVSAAASGTTDFVVSYLNPTLFEKGSTTSRGYVSYFSTPPAPVEDLEFVSTGDVVYIDEAGWRSMVAGEARPLVLGDVNHCSLFRRLGILRESSSSIRVHDSFLERSRGAIDKINGIAERQTRLNIVESQLFYIRGVESISLATPALVCCLQGSALTDPRILESYERLFDVGPVGSQLPDKAADVLLYLDSVLNSNGTEAFLLEMLEVLPLDQQRFLLNVLNRKLS